MYLHKCVHSGDLQLCYRLFSSSSVPPYTVRHTVAFGFNNLYYLYIGYRVQCIPFPYHTLHHPQSKTIPLPRALSFQFEFLRYRNILFFFCCSLFVSHCFTSSCVVPFQPFMPTVHTYRVSFSVWSVSSLCTQQGRTMRPPAILNFL